MGLSSRWIGPASETPEVRHTPRRGGTHEHPGRRICPHNIASQFDPGPTRSGGQASLSGTFWGVLTLGVLEEGLRGASIWGDQYLPFKISHFRYVLLGAFLVSAVWFNQPGKNRA